MCPTCRITPALPDGIERGIGVVERERERLLAEDVLAGRRGGHNRRQVIFRRRRDDDRVEPGMRRECFDAAIGGIDFEFGGDRAGAFQVDIGHRHQAGVRNRAAKVLGVAAAHLAYTDYTYVESVHDFSLGGAVDSRTISSPGTLMLWLEFDPARISSSVSIASRPICGMG